MKATFDYSTNGWKRAQEWAEQQPSPSTIHVNLWEWANAMGKESTEVLHLVSTAYEKNVNNSSSESFTK